MRTSRSLQRTVALRVSAGRHRGKLGAHSAPPCAPTLAALVHAGLLMDKIKVNGSDTHPVWMWLKAKAGGGPVLWCGGSGRARVGGWPSR